MTKNTTRVLVIGLEPSLVDFSTMPDMNAEKVRAGLDRFSSILLLSMTQSGLALALLAVAPAPAAAAWPWIAATEMISGRRSHVKACWKRAAASSASAVGAATRSRNVGCPDASPARNARSKPAENDGPSPRTTTTRTERSSSSPMTRSASHVAGVCALRFSGRFIQTVFTGPLCSTMTLLMVLPSSVIVSCRSR